MENVEPPVKPTSPTSPDTTPAPAPTAVAKPSLKERFSALLKEYGPVAFLVYFSIFFVCIAGFSVAIKAGLAETLSQQFDVQLDGTGGLAGTLFAAWAVTKVIQVPRIFATLVLTPLVGRISFVARFLKRFQESAG
jgi:hypothetical protein